MLVLNEKKKTIRELMKALDEALGVGGGEGGVGSEGGETTKTL